MAAPARPIATELLLSEKAPPTQVTIAYGVFLTSAIGVYWLVANGEFSSILTLSVMCQCLAFVLLALQVNMRGSASGISKRALALEALALVSRLASTTWLNGYLPVDASGDYVFQITEAVTLVIAMWLCWAVQKEQQVNNEAELDDLPIHWLVLGCVVLAALLHADMNSRPLFDTFWMLSTIVGAVAMLPQLWLIRQLQGKIEALTCHRIAVMLLSRLLSGAFMWHAREDITCDPWITGINHAVWAILGAHLFYMVVLGDFTYYYLKNVLVKGFSSEEMDLELDLV